MNDTVNRPTIAERQAQKRAAHRAKLGLPPVCATTDGMNYGEGRYLSITGKPLRRARRDRTADRIDGYDRDDLGESPDW